MALRLIEGQRKAVVGGECQLVGPNPLDREPACSQRPPLQPRLLGERRFVCAQGVFEAE